MAKSDQYTSVNLRLFNDHLVLTTWSGAEYHISPDQEGMDSILSVLRVLGQKQTGTYRSQQLRPAPKGAEHLTPFVVRTFDAHGKETTLEDL